MTKEGVQCEGYVYFKMFIIKAYFDQ